LPEENITLIQGGTSHQAFFFSGLYPGYQAENLKTCHWNTWFELGDVHRGIEQMNLRRPGVGKIQKGRTVWPFFFRECQEVY